MRDEAPLRIVVTGSESTGKTTLARRLAAWLGTVWVPEFSRRYAETKPAPLDASDVLPIAQGTLLVEDAIAPEANGGVIVLDTDLASTLVYARHYYDLVPEEVEARWRERTVALYLLCHPDVPWIADGVRDQPDERERIHDMFAAQVAASGAPVVDVDGTDWEAREAIARDAVRRLLPARSLP